MLDRERCVLCWRCVRFSDEIAGDRFIQLVDRGAGTQILTFNDDPFDSYFSGNTIQICPVGALTSKPYRFVSRPWDLETAPSVCGYCSVGCPITNEARAGKLVRCQALPNENVNDFWICDKGRFGYHYVSSEDRLEDAARARRDESSSRCRGATAVDSDRRRSSKEQEGRRDRRRAPDDRGRLRDRKLGTWRRSRRRDIDSRIQDAGAPYEAALSLGRRRVDARRSNDLESRDDDRLGRARPERDPAGPVPAFAKAVLDRRSAS